MKQEMGEKLRELLKEVRPLDYNAMEAAKERQDALAKVPGSLGKLEEISIRLAGITGKLYNDLKMQAIVVMCSDNGVWDEGIASAPQWVTQLQTINIAKRITGVGSMAKYYDIDLLVINLGVKDDISQKLTTTSYLGEDGRVSQKIVNRLIRHSTSNLAKEPAMSREEALQAIMVGIESVKALKDAGIQVFGVGEMGIGNTTTSACVMGAITGARSDVTVGRGGGLNNEGLAKKCKVVDEAVSRVRDKRLDMIDALAEVGGFDICAMTGAFLGAAIYRLPVVIDGYISLVAACAAQEICPSIRDFVFASHKSMEKGYLLGMEALGQKPMFDLNMRLGEGSGCPIAFKIMETATASMNLMKTLAEASINDSYMDECRQGNFY